MRAVIPADSLSQFVSNKRGESEIFDMLENPPIFDQTTM